MIEDRAGTVGRLKQSADGEFVVFGTRDCGKQLIIKLPWSCWPKLLHSLAHPLDLRAVAALRVHYAQHQSPNPEVPLGTFAWRAEQWWLREGYGRLPPLNSAAYDGMLRDYGKAVREGDDAA